MIEALNKEEKEFRIEFSFYEMAWGTTPHDFPFTPLGPVDKAPAGFRVGGGSWRWSMEVNIPLSTLPLQLEQAFVGCPLSFVRESLVSLGRRLTRP